jgi:hypothetical protein
MKQQDEAWWARARQARDQLAAQILTHPAISLIDIGLDPQGLHDTPVVRVHIRPSASAAPPVPNEIDGIPVRVIHGDYSPQHGSSARKEGDS